MKVVRDNSTMVGQFYACDVISANGAAPSSNVTPSSTVQPFWAALMVTAAGTLIVDTLGVNGANPQTSLTISVPAGVVQLAVTKVHSGGTATGITGLY